MAIYIDGPTGISWEEARSKVRGDLWRPGNSLPDDIVDRALHASMLELEGEASWVWLENLVVVATTEERAAYIDLPGSVGRVTAIAYRSDDMLDPLVAAPLATVRAESGTCTGAPSRYAYSDNRVWFDSIVEPSTEFELIVSASTPEELTDAITAPPFTLQRQQQAVIANACHYVALTFMKNEQEAARQRGAYDRVLERLHNVEAQRRGGMVQPDTWGYACG